MSNPKNGSVFPDKSTFIKNYETGKSQILSQWIPADLNTPVSAYLKLAADNPYSFLLESVEGGEILGRYSAIGFSPDLLWKFENNTVFTKSFPADDSAQTTDTDDGWQPRPSDRPPMAQLQDTINESKIECADKTLPPMAAPGLFGYLGYDMIRLVEDIPETNPDPLDMPESILMRPTAMVIFDNIKHMALITVAVRPDTDSGTKDPGKIYIAAKDKLTAIIRTLSGPVSNHEYKTTLKTPLKPESNVNRQTYESMVKKAIDYIYAGDIFQAVPSQRFAVDFDLPPVALYRTLRRLNPSPFLFHLNMGDFSLVGSSPEILVRVRQDEVTIRPIAGTRKRGKTPEEDKALADDLLDDPKERAEHLMLLDLARNDVGRVAEIGSINVTDRFIIEYYSHVMHIVSNVTGRLASDKTPLEALFSGFPAGTVSGAPKVRAMEIIEELEPHARRFYGGCIGYFDGHGEIDSCIALRTALIKDGKAYIQSGGGVVADSDPGFEYEESRNKAKALIRAAEMAVEEASRE